MGPLAVIVSGAPGSGKTTLACAIAQQMQLPHVERDRVLLGIQTTFGRPIDRSKEGIDGYYSCIAAMLDMNISLVTDGTLYAGLSEDQVKNHIVSRATVVNVHARAQNEHQRFYDREMNREGWSNDWVKAHMSHLDKIYDQTVDPLDLGVPVIEVDTNSDYKPSIKEVVASVTRLFEEAKMA